MPRTIGALLTGEGETPMSIPIPAVWQRLATAVVFIPIFVWVVAAAPAAVFYALVVAVGGAASWELLRMFERAGHRTLGPIGVAATITTIGGFIVSDRGPLIAFTLAAFVVLSVPIFMRGELATAPALTAVLSMTYIGWLLGHAIVLRQLPDGAWLVLFAVGATWAGESAAYAAGNAVGRHPLAPRVSPRKTVEGAAAQVVVSVLAAMLLRAWLVPYWSVLQASLAGLLLGVVGQVGDLAESVIKRSLNTKDTGGLIPGHGGVLDRLDSLLFNVPALVYYVTLLEISA